MMEIGMNFKHGIVGTKELLTKHLDRATTKGNYFPSPFTRNLCIATFATLPAT
jgi:hypothetical protein